MTLTKIFSGMEKGPEAIDTNFKALDESSPKIITDWSSAGISYKNGCTENTDVKNRIQYRVTKLGGSNLLSIVGWLKVPALNKNQSIIAFTLPMSVASQVNKFGFAIGEEHNTWGDILVGYNLNRQTGDFSIHNESSRDDGKVDAYSYVVNYVYLA